MIVQSRSEAPDAYAAFDSAADRLQTRLQRYKGRLIDRRRGDRATSESRPETVPHYVLAADSGEWAEDPEHGQPAIIAEQVSEVAVLSVGEAVMRMDLGDLPILMFRNRAHHRMNVIYRRPDGTVGWIDPPPRAT